MQPRLTHLDEHGQARMVDVGDKAVTQRLARAEGYLYLPVDLLDQLTTLKKGNALEVARLAGIMATKRTADLIPLCHPLPIEKVELQLEPQREAQRVRVQAEVRCEAKTGVEMEALTAVSVALLTLYDMGKAIARDMRIDGIRLLYKSGGKSGVFQVENGEVSPNSPA